jgi:glycosyltransferase involved in cell wall biosynthesis
MKILIACLNANGLGGSELYHYELSKGLKLQGEDVTLFSMININEEDETRKKLSSLNIKQVDTRSIDFSINYDIIVASQPQTNRYIISNFPNTPIISIIHSEIRSEDPIIHSNIRHYIAIRPSIVDLLIKEYKIQKNKISLIYNPIDTNRFNSLNNKNENKITGVFVGEVLDPIRFKAVNHIVNHCIKNDWNLKIISESRYDFNHQNISYLNKIWNTETIVKHCNFTAGILLGRTTLEGLCCGIPGYVYLIDKFGNIQSIELIDNCDLVNQCDSKFVIQQHIHLYSKLLNDK